MKKPKVPTPEEDPAVGALRDRQMEELADLDEEENRRLKAAFVNRRGVRAFRRASNQSSGPIGSTTGGNFGGRAFRTKGGFGTVTP